METITIKNKSYSMTYHAKQRIQERFYGINLQEAISRGKFVDDNNVSKFGKFMFNKLRLMKQEYSNTVRLVINPYYNLAVALDIKANVIITALYADGTISRSYENC